MGKQLAVYLSAPDMAAVEQRLADECGAVFIAARHAGELIPQTTLIAHDENGCRSFGYLVRPEDLGKIKLRFVSEEQGWRVDDLRSPVVEFDAGYEDRNVVTRGRLHFDRGFFDSTGNWVEKSSSFVSWAESVIRSTRRMLTRDPKLGAYVGDAALKARTAGRAFSAL